MIILLIIIKLEFVNQEFVSSKIKDIWLDNNIMYLATLAGVEIIDIYNLEKISFSNTDGQSESIFIKDNYIYVADGHGGLKIIDASNLNKLKEIMKIPTYHYAKKVAGIGNKLYICDCDSGLIVMDITYPKKPFIVKKYNTYGASIDINIKFPYAYAIDYPNGIWVIDIFKQQKIEFLPIYGAKKIIIKDSIAFILSENIGIKKMNIKNKELKDVYTNKILDFDVSDNYLYVGERGQIKIIDIENKIVISKYEIKYPYIQKVLFDKYLFVCTDKNVHILDVKNPSIPIEITKYTAKEEVFSLYLEKNYLYTANYGDGIKIIDIKNPNSPVVKGEFNTPGAVWDVFTFKNYICVADDVGGVWFINPQVPKLTTGIKGKGYARKIFIKDDIAYIADYGYGLLILDVSIPDIPKQIAHYKTFSKIWDIKFYSDAHQNYIFLAEGEEGVRILDVSDPKKPKYINKFDTEGFVWSILIHSDGNQDYCYIADGDFGIKIINIEDMSNIYKIGELRIKGSATGLAIKNNLLYVATGYEGIKVIDINNPAKPIEIEHYDTPGYARDIEIQDSYIFVADREGGLITLQIK